jgi:V8-like Glu-specific endopeptidase
MLTFILGLISLGFASPDVVYGPDSRKDLFEVKHKPYIKWAQSVAAMVPKTAVTFKDKTSVFKGMPLATKLKESYNMPLCEGEKFAGQPSLGRCSAFLVAPDTMVSAGHCFSGKECEENYLVFNFVARYESQRDFNGLKQDVYKCKEVLHQTFSDAADYAIIKLDRSVTGVTPLKLASSSPSPYSPVILIGHPSGLPMKIADDAIVISSTASSFTASLDSFAGNSGSPVINPLNGEVQGVLVNGQGDYGVNLDSGCLRVFKRGTGEGGETVSGTSQFSALLK